MTDTELKKLIEDCCDDIFNRLEPLANVKSRFYESLKPAIDVNGCCTTSYCNCTQPSMQKPISETEYECFDCGKEVKQ